MHICIHPLTAMGWQSYASLCLMVIQMRRLSQPCGRYVEVHMEQGPVLEAAGLSLGVVSGIAGQTRLSVILKGAQVGCCPCRSHQLHMLHSPAYSFPMLRLPREP